MDECKSRGGGHQRDGLGAGLKLLFGAHAWWPPRTLSSSFRKYPGDSPRIGGCIVPYRKWPKGAKLFHEMICVARPINAKEALEIGMGV